MNLKGYYLIAAPTLLEEDFRQAVILVCEHNEEGAFGLVVNDICNYNADEVVTNYQFPEGIKLYFGGPVQHNTLHFLHRIPSLEDCLPVSENIYWSGSFEPLLMSLDLGTVSKHDVRFFLGYAGWSSNQLEEELKEGSWYTLQANEFNFFDAHPSTMWATILKKARSS